MINNRSSLRLTLMGLILLLQSRLLLPAGDVQPVLANGNRPNVAQARQGLGVAKPTAPSRIFNTRIDVGYMPDYDLIKKLPNLIGDYGASYYPKLQDNFSLFLGVSDFDRFIAELVSPRSMDQFNENCLKLFELDRLLSISKNNPSAAKAANAFIIATKKSLLRKEMESGGQLANLSAEQREEIKEREKRELEATLALFIDYYKAIDIGRSGTRSTYNLLAINGILRSIKNAPDQAIKITSIFKAFDYANTQSDAYGVQGLNVEKDYPLAKFSENLSEDKVFVGALVADDLRLYYNKGVSYDKKKPSASHDSLLAKLRRTRTVYGTVFLDYLFSHPTIDRQVLLARQDFIAKLVENEDFYKRLVACLDKISFAQHECANYINKNDPILAELRPKSVMAKVWKDFYPEKAETISILWGLQKFFISIGLYNFSNMIEELFRSHAFTSYAQVQIFLDYFFMITKGSKHLQRALGTLLARSHPHNILLKYSESSEDLDCKFVKGGDWIYNLIIGRYARFNIPMKVLFQVIPRIVAPRGALTDYIYQDIPEPLQSTIWKTARGAWGIVSLAQDGSYVYDFLREKHDEIEPFKREIARITKTVQGLRTLAIEAEKIGQLLVQYKVDRKALSLFDELEFFNSQSITVGGKTFVNKEFKKLVNYLKKLPANMSSARALSVYRTVYCNRYMFAPLLEDIGEVDAISSAATMILETKNTTNKYNFVSFAPECSSAIVLKSVWYPYFNPNTAVSNDVILPSAIGSENSDLSAQHMLISGINFGGKTTMLRTILISALMAQVWGIVPADKWIDSSNGKLNNPVMPIYSYIGSAINIEDDPSSGNSRFTAQVRAIERERLSMAKQTIVSYRAQKPLLPKLLVVDEIFNGTGATDGVSLGIAYLEDFVKINPNISLIVSTHFAPINWITKYPFSRGVVNFIAPSDQQKDKFKIFRTPFEPCVPHQYSGSSSGISQAEAQCKIDQKIIARAKEIREQIFTIGNPNLA